MADHVALFIDGAYLDYVLRDEFSRARVDFTEMANSMVAGADILRTYYYHCLPYQSSPPTAEESERYAARRRFFTALERLPRFQVRLGRLELRYGPDGSRRFEQKRVDILLGVDLVQRAAKGRIQHAVVLAGDSDFIPAVNVAKSEGVLVRLFHGEGCHSELWQAADERVKLDQSFIDAIRQSHQ